MRWFGKSSQPAGNLTAARGAQRGGTGGVKAVARREGLTLKAAAQYAAALGQAETHGVHTGRGARASDRAAEIADNPRNWKDW